MTPETRYLPTHKQLRDHLNAWHAVTYEKSRNFALIPLADWHTFDHTYHAHTLSRSEFEAHDATDYSGELPSSLERLTIRVSDLDGDADSWTHDVQGREAAIEQARTIAAASLAQGLNDLVEVETMTGHVIWASNYDPKAVNR